jgi:hypothetical protein
MFNKCGGLKLSHIFELLASFDRHTKLTKKQYMYNQKTVKAFSIVAIVLSIIGLLISILGTFFLTQADYTLGFFLGIISWGLLLWASIIGYKLCTSYKLYEDEYKKVAIRIYLIVVAFILFFLVGLVIGLVLSVGLLSTLWGLKRNYDEWEYRNTPYTPEVIDTTETTNSNESTSSN